MNFSIPTILLKPLLSHKLFKVCKKLSKARISTFKLKPTCNFFTLLSYYLNGKNKKNTLFYLRKVLGQGFSNYRAKSTPLIKKKSLIEKKLIK